MLMTDILAVLPNNFDYFLAVRFISATKIVGNKILKTKALISKVQAVQVKKKVSLEFWNVNSIANYYRRKLRTFCLRVDAL